MCGTRLNGSVHAQRGADAQNRTAGQRRIHAVRPQEADAVAMDGKLSVEAKGNIFKVGKSANRVQRINRQALRFAIAGLARLYPENPNTFVRRPSALSDGNYGANWTRAGTLRTRFKELVKPARSNIAPSISSYIWVYKTGRRDLVAACCDFSRFPSSNLQISEADEDTSV